MLKKSGTHNIRVPGIMGTQNILQLFLWQALECSEISSPIIKPIKNPSEPIFFSCWVPKKYNSYILWGHNISVVSFFGVIKDVHARTYQQSPCLDGRLQGPWTSRQSPREDLARSIFLLLQKWILLSSSRVTGQLNQQGRV
jgi:hypothetical protein